MKRVRRPLERLVIDVPTEFMGIVTEHIGPRRGVMLDQRLEGDRMRLEYTIPTRGISVKKPSPYHYPRYRNRSPRL